MLTPKTRRRQRNQRNSENTKVNSKAKVKTKPAAKQGDNVVKVKAKVRRRNRQLQRKVILSDTRVGGTNMTQSTSQELETAVSSIVYSTNVNLLSIQASAIGVVASALQRGYEAIAETSNYPYFAYRYIYDMLVSYARNSVPAGTSVPEFLALIGQSLVPKKVPKGTGSVSYRFNVPDSAQADPTWLIPIGPNGECALNFGIVTGNKINNLIPIIAEPTVSYTPEQGMKAWTSVLEFIQSQNGSTGMLRLVPADDENLMTTDPSAFAAITINPGGGLGSGGWMYQAFLETVISKPIFTGYGNLFTPLVSQTQSSRYPVHIKNYAGSKLWSTTCLMELASKQELGTTSPPRFHAVDFNEFVNVVALYLQKAVETAVNSADDVLAEVVSAEYLSKYTLNLTFQEFKILLRNVLMNAFKWTQSGVQDLYPFYTNGNRKPFLPFSSTVGTCARIGGTSMLLPVPIVENIRSLTSVKNIGGPNKQRNPTYFVPVLGAYKDDALDGDSYKVDVSFGTGDNITHVTIPIFTNGSTSVMKADKVSGKMVGTAESPISMFDGSVSTSNTPPNSFCAINDAGVLNTLVVGWNNYVRDTIGSYSVGLTALGTDGGINVLRSISSTRFWTPAQQDSSVARFKRVGSNSSFYDNRAVQVVTLEGIPLQQVWETFGQYMIRPTMSMVASDDPRSSTVYQKISAAMGETHSLIYAESVIPVTLQSLHDQLATLSVKTRFSDKTDIEKFLDEMSRRGRGGILSSLVAEFAATGIKAIASAVPL